MREIENLIFVKHSTLIEFKGFTLDSSSGLRLLILTEYYPNGSIDSKLNQSNFRTVSNTDKMIWIFGIAVGMVYLHSWRIQHRDLKPLNVFIDSELRPRIGDLGSAKIYSMIDSLLQSKHATTLHYTAPEMLTDEKGSWEADVYGFGMTVYQIVTGVTPLGEIKNSYKYTQMVSEGKRPEFPQAIGDNLRSLIESCWAQNPTDRPSFLAIVRSLISFGPLFPNVDDRYQMYVQKLSSQRLTFIYEGQTRENTFDFLDCISDIRRWVSNSFRLLNVELVYDGSVLNDSNPFFALSFDPSKPILVNRPSGRWVSESLNDPTNSIKVEVRLPLGDLIEMEVPTTSDVKTILDRLVTDFDISDLSAPRSLILLGFDKKRLSLN
jgi:serine/threonine protein kinase